MQRLLEVQILSIVRSRIQIAICGGRTQMILYLLGIPVALRRLFHSFTKIRGAWAIQHEPIMILFV